MKTTRSRCQAALALIIAGTLVMGLSPATIPSAAAAPQTLLVQVNSAASAITVVESEQFLVRARGFKAGEFIKVQVSFPAYSGTTIVQSRTIQANKFGAVLTPAMSAPPGTRAGPSSVTAVGLSSGRQAQGSVQVVYQPSIALNPLAVNPGSPFAVNGHGFVANALVRIQVKYRGVHGTPQTLSGSTTADSNGNFSLSMAFPAFAAPGAYTVVATDSIGGFTRDAIITVNQRPAPRPTSTPTATRTPTPLPTPTSTPKPVIHAAVSVVPSVTLPNQNIAFSGSGFPTNVFVTVGLSVTLRSGALRAPTRNLVTDSNGNFVTTFRVPFKTAPGIYSATAVASGARAATQFQVLPLPVHHHALRFSSISLWYHTVRQGTWDRVIVQASPHTKLGIWVHVVFPSGAHRDFYKETNRKGRWTTRFTIPRHATSSRSHVAYITLQLWHGSQTAQAFLAFKVV